MSDSFVETGDKIKIQDDNSMYMGRKKNRGPNWFCHLIDPHVSLTLGFAFTHPIPGLQSKPGMKLEGKTRAQ
jgi:hypothetical protein